MTLSLETALPTQCLEKRIHTPSSSFSLTQPRTLPVGKCNQKSESKAACQCRPTSWGTSTEQVRKGWSDSGEVNGSYSAKWLPISTRISGRQDPTSAPIPLANLSAQWPSTHQAHPCLSSPVPAAFSAQNAFPPNTGIACSLSQNITSAAASFITTVYKNLPCSYPIHP